MRVAEFYSGIGGMQCAIKRAAKGLGISDDNFTVVAAFDINNHANLVYKSNFPGTPVVQKNLESITIEYFDRLEADLFTMSPPCQPYTRMGRQQHSRDPRAKSFQNLIEHVLPAMKRKPRWILVENVKGFDGSDSRDLLVRVLKQCGYRFWEYLLNPLQFGVPNSRLRYYLFAEFVGVDKTTSESQLMTKLSPENMINVENQLLQDYLEQDLAVDSSLHLSNQQLWRYGGIVDIVDRQSKQSCCFTKNYFRMLEGTGSMIKTNNDRSIKEAFDPYFELVRATPAASKQYDIECDECPLRVLGLRFFSPREILRLLQFPEDFKFPPDIGAKQQYRLLGNSINVHVVSCVLREHLLNHNQ